MDIGLCRMPRECYFHGFLGRETDVNFSTYYGRAVPIQIVLPVFSNYVLSGPEWVAAYFRESRDLCTTARGLTTLENAFGCPNHLVDLFRPQITPSKPETKSKSRPEEDIEYLMHRAINTALSGAPLDSLTAHFQEHLVKQIEDSASEIGADWIAFPDLTSFLGRHVFEAATRSMFGTYLFSLNPTLAEDFWNHNRFIGALFMGLPRWLNPVAYRAREKMLKNFVRWQKYAREHCDIADLGDVEWEPYYGSKYTRERQNFLTTRGIINETARAAENFAFIWA